LNTLLIIVCSIISGAGFTFLLYSKKSPWSEQTNIFIAIFRFLSVALLVYMIISPFVKSNQTITEKSKLVIAIDNSTSVANGLEKNLELVKTKLETLQNKLGNKFDIKIFNLDGSFTKKIEDLDFTKKETDISNMLSLVNNSLEASDVKGMILLTDGIVNKGTSPLFSNFSYPIFTLGIGDTTKPKDVILINCLYNNIVGINNRFPISVEIKSYGYKGKSLNVSIFSGKIKLQSKILLITDNEFSGVVSFENSEKEPGIKHYTIVAQPIAGEFTEKNNQKEIYFEVIEVRQRIAVLSPFPHPDIKALVASLNGNENIEVQTFIMGIDEFPTDKFDLVIAYQLPAISEGYNKYLDGYIKNNTPILFVIGGATSISDLNVLLPNLKILAQQGQFDKVTGTLNPAFSRLNFNAGLTQFLDKSPPLIVPFGEYNLGAGWDVILNQKVGTIPTQKPLFAIYSGEGRSYGLVFGEGMWQWRMNEYAENQNTIVFDDIIKKTTTLLAQKTDKRKFRCNTSEKIYEENTPIIFKIETYNDIYEQVFDKEIRLDIKDAKGKTFNYKFVNSLTVPNFVLNGLMPGGYTFTSKTTLSGKEQMIKGEFSIQSISLENITQVADFELLRNISNQTTGHFYTLSHFDSLASEIDKLDANEKVYKVESVTEIITFKVLLFILIVILGFEWGIRKFLSQV